MYAFDGATYKNINGTTNASGQVTLTLPFGNYRFRADKNGTQFWSGATNHCPIPGCTSVSIATTLLTIVTVRDTDGMTQPGLPVYAFDGSTYTNYNGTTNASGQVTLTLPFGNYRFRADKNGTQYWSGPSNHCTVPGCTTATVTLTTGGASNGGRALARTRLPVNDPGLLLLAPLAVLALSRRKGKRQRWATLAAAMLLAVAVMGMGTMVAGDDSLPVVLAAQPASAVSESSRLANARSLDDSSSAPQMSVVAPRPAAAQVLTTTTTVIRYTYDPLQRLTSATYSDGKSFQYEYDAVGNRTVSTQTITSTLVTSYTYDAANRLTWVSGQAYTWDNNGNLLNDGSKSYLCNQANQLITVTASGLTWNASYNGDGARLRQVTNGVPTAYTLDLTAPLVTALTERTGATTKQYVYGQGDSPLASHDGTLSGVEGWTYLSGRDGLNSVRQETDAAGDVWVVRSFDPYGVPLQGDGGSPFGYTGEVADITGLLFLRARYLTAEGRFITKDMWHGNPVAPLTLHPYVYGLANPISFTDPSGHISEGEKFYIRTLYNWYIRDTANRLNVHSLTNLSDNAFSAMIAAKILVEDATIYSDDLWNGLLKEVSTIPPTFLRDWARNCAEDWIFGGEISWGPANIPLPLAIQNLKWWEQNYQQLGLNFEDVHTYYYSARNRNWLLRWLLGSEETQVTWELQTGEGTVHAVALAILQSSDRARNYWASVGQPSHQLSAYVIALGVNAYGRSDSKLYPLDRWTSKGSHWDWANAIAPAAEVLGLHIIEPEDYIRYTEEERDLLRKLPEG